MGNTQKKIKWYMLAFMVFSTVWSFQNIVNGYVYFNGTQVIFSWIFMFALYFVPYALMVGELGSAFKSSGGGVTAWISKTGGKKLAYYAGYTYWAVHITYIAFKGSNGLKALSWMLFQNAETYDSIPTLYVQIITMVAFLFFCWVASKGLNILKKLTTIAGLSMFVMSILFIFMMFAAPVVNSNVQHLTLDLSWKALIPQFDMKYFTSLSILVFAVGGCERISPYVNKVENPAKGFPKGLISLAIMVAVTAILGTIALGLMINPAEINASDTAFNHYLANGAYLAFIKVGQYYHVGNLLMIIYAACNAIGQFATLVLSIDAPLRMLLEDENVREYVPTGLLKQNKHGAYTNGIKMVGILSGAIIFTQILVPGATGVLAQLNKLNSVCMPMRYLWVFTAYFLLRRAKNKFPREYHFTKSQPIAILAALWCFLVTATCCILGMYSTDAMTMIMNICTPIVLVALGLIMPMIRRRQDV